MIQEKSFAILTLGGLHPLGCVKKESGLPDDRGRILPVERL
jgi:hypothetical protein